MTQLLYTNSYKDIFSKNSQNSDCKISECPIKIR